jgi:2,3-diaminopropionate biosynthesis protein SbnB
MIYIGEQHINELAISWKRVVASIEQAVRLVYNGDYKQPVKPYLRYKELTNRIIAMPAFLGGAVNTAGIKWIASFPKNIEQGLARAHSVTILNEADTGVPYCIINTNKISAIRTAGVTGAIIKKYLEQKEAAADSLEIGMTGFGPIGSMHLALLRELWLDKIKTIRIFDVRPIDISVLPEDIRAKTIVVDAWEAAYTPADIFITCTVSKAPYINLPPKAGSLQANVSLRDYQADTRKFMSRIIVDDWEEICRENTDIEVMHKVSGLEKEDTFSFIDTSLDDLFAGITAKDVVMFNPMGMAAFDIAIAHLYFEEANALDIKVAL